MDTFLEWYQAQEGAVKAAVITGGLSFLGLFISGCFVITAAIITKPPSPKPVVLPTFIIPTVTPIPSPASMISPTPTLKGIPAAATPEPQTPIPATNPISIPQRLEGFFNSLP